MTTRIYLVEGDGLPLRGVWYAIDAYTTDELAQAARRWHVAHDTLLRGYRVRECWLYDEAREWEADSIEE